MISNMDVSLQTIEIDLEDIDIEDDTFQISTGIVSEDLVCSIKQFGLISLPILFPQNKQFKKKWKIVCGFKRVVACKKAGLKKIEIRVVSGKDNIEINRNCLLLSIADNAAKRQLNFIEQSRAVVKLLKFSSDNHNDKSATAKKIHIIKERLFCELSKIFGISQNYSYFEKLITLSKLPSKVQELIINETITMTVALELSVFEEETMLLFAEYFEKLKFNLNKQREFIILIREIAIRENISFIDLLNNKFLRDLKNNNDLDGNIRIRQIRLFLKKRRFPAISNAEDLFQEHLKKLKLGNNAKLIPPRNFEGTIYSLNFTFSNMKQLEKHKLLMEQLSQNISLLKILERPVT